MRPPFALSSLFFAILLINCRPLLADDILKVSARDSYLDAYQDSKNVQNQAEKKSDGFFSGYPASGGQYGPPINQYGPPINQYGPPINQYGPSNNYGGFAEPAPQYIPQQMYGPPAQNLQVFYGVPHAMISIWDKIWEKIKWKLDLFTFGKILLKLVIFKKIVSFIGILCLLLFIPSLKHKKGYFNNEEEGNERSLRANENLNDLTSFVKEAIDDYLSINEHLESTPCNSKYCKAKKMIKKIEKKTSYKRLAELYAFES